MDNDDGCAVATGTREWSGLSVCVGASEFTREVSKPNVITLKAGRNGVLWKMAATRAAGSGRVISSVRSIPGANWKKRQRTGAVQNLAVADNQ